MKRKLQLLFKRQIAQLMVLTMLSVVSFNAWANELFQDIRQVKVTISFNGETLEKAVKRLSEVSQVPFNYNHNELRKLSAKQLTFTDEPLTHVLNAILNGTNFQYKEGENGVVIYRSPKNQENNLGSTNIEATDPVTVKGIVSDKDGPIPGVSVSVKQSSTGTNTGADGSYSIKVNTGQTLVFSMIGYRTKEITVGSQTTINVTLESDITQLEEVVAVGYGTQKKVNLTGAIGTVKTEMLTSRPVSSLQSSLQGTMPGVTVLSRPGDVGTDASNVTVTIRGRGNFGSSTPFYVVDGIPVTTSDFTAINPNDIENISVLKDAASAAIYGNRAAHGVILVTTKKGKEGKASVSFSSSFGWQNPLVLPDYLGSVDFASLTNEARANAGQAPRFTADEIEKFRSGSDPNLYPNTNWYDLALRENAGIQDYQLNISGGGKTSYYIGMGIMDQQSLKVSKDFSRYSLRINTDSEVGTRFKIGTKTSFVYENLKNDGGDFSFVSLNRMVPSMAARQTMADGSWLWGTINGGKLDATLAKDNPLRLQEEGGLDFRKDYRLITSLNADFKIIDGLFIHGIASLNYFQRRLGKFENETKPLINYLNGTEIPGSASTPNKYTENWTQKNRITLQGFADYEKKIGKHYGKLMAGGSYETYRGDFIGANRQEFVNNNTHVVDGGAAPINSVGSNGFASETAQASFFGRFNYSFLDKYLIETNLRADGSSIFHPDYRWGVFPSVSAGWRMSEESFMKNISWLSNLKLRASWGKLGNIANQPLITRNDYNEPDDYPYFEALETGYAYNFDGSAVNGVWAGKGVNILTTWEKAEITDIGVDAGFFNGKLDVTADYFIKNTTDILLQQKTLPNTYYQDAPYINAGAVRNKGFELGINYNNKIENFNYNIGVNLAKIVNEVTNLNGDIQQIDGRYVDRLGFARGSFFGYESQGLFATNEEVAEHAFQSAATKAGDIKYKDQNGDNKIDDEDRVIIGNDVPYFTYGLNLGASYKGFDLAIMGQGAQDVKIYLDNEASFAFFNGSGVKGLHLKRWTKENPDPNAAYPRLLPSADNSKTTNTKASDFWLFDASYFRIKSIVFGYNLPKTLISKTPVKSARFYISAQNPYTFMFDNRLKDYDPEAPSGRANYPATKTWSLGLNIQF